MTSTDIWTKFVGLVSGVGLFVLSCSAAQAASWQECDGNKIVWNSGWANMAISTTSFPAGSVWDAQLQNAMWHWNNVKGSGFNYYVLQDTDGTHSSGNGVNELYFDSSGEVGSALAVTSVRSQCYLLFGTQIVISGIEETDIAFNLTYAWSTDAFVYSSLGSPYSYEGVALHELGHALGLYHEDRLLATMNSLYPTTGPLGYYKEWDASADDRVGARLLYPDSTTETDVAGSAFKSTGSGTSGLVTSPTSAARDTYVTIEFTFSNLSTATQAFDIGFYLSTNDYISTYDAWLGTNYGAYGDSGFTGTFTRTLYIPTTVAPGTYWLGFLIDPFNATGEANETNNIQPMPVSITIY